MNNNFSENLKRIRKDNNISQEQLAEELGVSRQAISKWESSTSYPEMDKIITICNKYNVKIDDLLYGNIKEIKSEEESKKKVNNYLNDFLKYITDTINMFISMDFKSKLKCILEQLIIIGLLALFGAIIFHLIDDLFEDIISIFPERAYYYIHSIIESILLVGILILSVGIFTHIFKTRYLDYYNKVKSNNKEEEKEELEEVKETKKGKISFKENEKKIVIRDPKHSEYKFINGLLKIIVFFIKSFVLFIATFFFVFLVFTFMCLVISFLISKTGLLFIGALLLCLSIGFITYIIILMLMNFIFNRKSNKKFMIVSFIFSLVFTGISIGLIFSGALDFEVVEKNDNYLVTETREYEMTDDFWIYTNFYDGAEFIEKDIKNIKVEFKKYDYYVVSENIDNYHGLGYYVSMENPFKAAKMFIKELNNKKVIYVNDGIYDMKIYASKENIKKLKVNYDKYYFINE